MPLGFSAFSYRLLDTLEILMCLWKTHLKTLAKWICIADLKICNKRGHCSALHFLKSASSDVFIIKIRIIFIKYSWILREKFLSRMSKNALRACKLWEVWGVVISFYNPIWSSWFLWAFEYSWNFGRPLLKSPFITDFKDFDVCSSWKLLQEQHTLNSLRSVIKGFLMY